MCIQKSNFKRLLIAFVICVLFIPFGFDAFALEHPDKLIPGGRTTGIRLYADGAVVTGFSSDNAPAKVGGIKVGDVITAVDGKAVYDKNTLLSALANASDKDVEIELLRGGKTVKLNVSAVFDTSKSVYSIGASVKDTIAGIGTVTYIVPETGEYGALGHGITDPDTRSLMPFDEGVLMPSTVTSVKRGVEGTPGELIGAYEMSEVQGSVDSNTICGIYGKLNDAENFCANCEMPVCEINEVKKGKAYILSNISGDDIVEFDIEIVEINKKTDDMKNMLIKVTDPDLLESTGGIVQGMSGSPIIQDGKLVGAVTHVLVNDPTRGYGIFIENMLEAAS
ncbi:MAG: SpoIVB peptidase [Clostridia bacterium]|nr:SpoIVB peptidase [Clostridia bacterium]